MKAQNLSTSLGEGRDVAPSLALPSQNPNLTVYTEELTHLVGLEAISLIDGNPQQILSLSCQFIASTREFLFRLEKFDARL
jgi:hypothetical protein